MQKIKDFFKKYKDVFSNLLYTMLIMSCLTLLSFVITVCTQSYITYQQAKYNQELQHCMYLLKQNTFTQNTAELCEFLINR